MAATKSWHVDAPVETVFGAFKNPEFGAELTPMQVHDIKVTKDGVGTNYAWDLKMGRLRLGGFEVLTDVVPNAKIVERSSWSMFGKWVYTFEPEGKGTKLTVEVEPQSLWGLPPLNRLVELGIDRMSRTMMPRFIEAMEREAKGEEKPARKRVASAKKRA